jgi:hypothetical protein
MGEPQSGIEAAEQIRRCRMTIGHFKRLIRRTGLRVTREKAYLIRPSHEVRYGWRTRVAPCGGVPWVREVLVTGVALLAERASG